MSKSAIERILEATGKTPVEIARAINASPQSINNWHKRGISKNGAKEISKAFGLSIDWILTGEGEMRENRKPTIEELQKQIKAIQNKGSLLEGNVFDERNTIPVISWVAAGSWTECQAVTLDDVIEELPRHIMMHDKCFGLKVRGESMLPDFKPNEYIYVDPNYGFFDLKNGDLVVVMETEKNEATFKQLVIGETSEDIYLRPLNPNWHEQKMLPKSEWQLIGKVIAKWVKL